MGNREPKQLSFLENMELQTREPSGNKSLIEYGITNEVSDYRVHVGYKVQHIYVFPTISGVEVIKQNNFRLLTVSLDGQIDTAEGYAVPVRMIEGIQQILIPLNIYREFPIHKNVSTTNKGLMAVSIVVEMLKDKLIPLPVKIDLAEDESIQIEGTDIIVSSLLKLQVKCDYRAGDKKLGGTGNVFLQVRECNPYKFI